MKLSHALTFFVFGAWVMASPIVERRGEPVDVLSEINGLWKRQEQVRYSVDLN